MCMKNQKSRMKPLIPHCKLEAVFGLLNRNATKSSQLFSALFLSKSKQFSAEIFLTQLCHHPSLSDSSSIHLPSEHRFFCFETRGSGRREAQPAEGRQPPTSTLVRCLREENIGKFCFYFPGFLVPGQLLLRKEACFCQLV